MSPRLIGVLCLAAGPALAQPGPHQAELERHHDHPVLTELVGNGGLPAEPLRPRPRPAGRERVVFGYLPYWIDREYYAQLDFDLLTHVSAFSVEVQADGTVGDDHGWPWTALVDSAHAHGVRVILTATLFGDGPVQSLVTDEARSQTFARAIRDRLREGRADGLNVDFEGPGANGWPSFINGFMASLTDYLHREVPGCEVSFAAPPVDWAGRWGFEGLAASCDYLYIMGYAFTGSWSDRSGPTAPLTGGGRNLTTTVTGDFGTVTRGSPEKLILGVPYYGCQWQTSGPAARAMAEGFVGYPRLADALPGAESHGYLWDGVSGTPWYRYQNGDRWHQVWYDDAVSLGMKYDLALQGKLRGVGVWALGYEGDRREPWDLLAQKIGRRSPPTAVAAEPLPGQVRLEQNYPNPFNGATQIAYDIPRAGRVEIEVFDGLGQQVLRRTVDHGRSGVYRWAWDGVDGRGRAAASGVYTYRVRFATGDGPTEVQRRRMVLAR
ncbi:MAG: glycosyl hydrolase family 18 protein [Gemmatimonadota bacterium]